MILQEGRDVIKYIHENRHSICTDFKQNQDFAQLILTMFQSCLCQTARYVYINVPSQYLYNIKSECSLPRVHVHTGMERQLHTTLHRQGTPVCVCACVCVSVSVCLCVCVRVCALHHCSSP